MVQSSQFILTGVPEPEDWLRLTSPTARILVDSTDTSKAMSPLRFRAGWGTRLVRQFSSLLSKSGNTIVSSPPSPRRKTTGALSRAPQVPHLIMSVATSTPKVSSTTVTTSTATSTLRRRRSRLGRSDTVSDSTGRRLTTGVESGKVLKSQSLPLGGYFDPDAPPILSTELTTVDDVSVRQKLHWSPTEPRSIGWWKRSVAGILSWSPDRYNQPLPVEKRNSRGSRRMRKEKERNRLTKKGCKMRVGENTNVVREFAWMSDPELALDVEHDPMLTSKTFDSSSPTSDLPWSASNDRNDMTLGLSDSQEEPVQAYSRRRNIDMPSRPSHHSEEAFRT